MKNILYDVRSRVLRYSLCVDIEYPATIDYIHYTRLAMFIQFKYYDR